MSIEARTHGQERRCKRTSLIHVDYAIREFWGGRQIFSRFAPESTEIGRVLSNSGQVCPTCAETRLELGGEHQVTQHHAPLAVHPFEMQRSQPARVPALSKAREHRASARSARTLVLLAVAFLLHTSFARNARGKPLMSDAELEEFRRPTLEKYEKEGSPCPRFGGLARDLASGSVCELISHLVAETR